MEVKKVLHIINSLGIGGAEKLVTDIAISNANMFDVITLKKTNSFYEQNLKNYRVNFSHLSNESVYNPLLILKIIPYLKKYNVIHVHLFPALYWVVLAKLISFSKAKIVYTEHNTNNRRRDNFVFKVLDNYIYSKLNFIGCISESTTTNLKKHIEKVDVPIQTIVNGIDLNRFNPNNIQPQNYNFFSNNDFVLIQVSSFRVQKDQKTLIQSVKKLPADIKLILVGDGELLEEHKLLVKQLDLEDRILFLGLRDDIPQLLNYASVNVLSSHYEGFGLVALEGMAMHKPVIASNVDGLRDVVEGAGLLFEKGNYEELSEKILSLYSSKDFYQKIADKCLVRAQKLDIKLMINNYLDVYSKFI